jgi:hypothetical protein
MSFITDIFSPPTPPQAPPALAAGVPQPAALPAAPTPPVAPTPPTQAQAPPSFAPTLAQASAQRSQVAAGTPTFLGAAASAGQLAKSKATLG